MGLMAMKTDQKLLDDVQAKAGALKVNQAQLARLLNVKRYHLNRIFMGAYTEVEWLDLVRFTNLTKYEIDELEHAYRLACKFERSGLIPSYKEKRFKKGDDIYALVHAIEHQRGDMIGCPADDIYMKTIHALMGVKREADVYDKRVVERLRREQGIGASELSVKMGYSRSWYQQFIKGSEFTLEKAVAFASYFGVKTSYFEVTDWRE